MVDEAGAVRLQVAVTQYAADGSVCGHQAITSSTTLSLLQIPLNGASGFVTVQTVGAGGFDVVDIPTAVPAETIPDGAGGVLAGWSYMVSGINPIMDTRISRLSPAGNAQYTLPLANWTFPNESMVLGENGVAFATDSQQVVSFDLSSGSLNWVWQSAAGTVRLHASLSDGGLAALDSGSHVVLISANGVESQTQVDLIGAQYHSVGIWKGQLPDGSLVTTVGPYIDLALSEWGFAQGSRQASRGRELPVVSVFIPTDPGSPSSPFGLLTAQIAADNIKQALGNKNTRHRFFLKEQATPEAFLKELKEPIAGVVFVGHSLLIANPQTQTTFSAGLLFYGDRALVRKPDPNVPELNYSVSIPNAVLVENFDTQLKLAYVGSCALGRAFTDLWSIGPTTQGRALVYTPHQAADLVQSVAGWIYVAEALLDPSLTTIQRAVEYANPKLIQNAQIANPPTAPIILQVHGDGNVRIRP